jgi:type I restriction enzyme S subunit
MNRPDIKLADGWAIDQLDDLVEILVSNVDKKTVENEPAVRLCNYMDVYSNEYITSKIDFMKATAPKSQLLKFAIKKGDVMITKDSETPDDIGIAAVSMEDFEDVVCGYHLALFKPKKDKIFGQFLAKQLGQYMVNRQFANRANGSTRYGLTLNVIETALIPYPVSLEKQQQIAHILTTCDTVIEQTQSAIAKYKAVKQGLLHDLFTRGLDANGRLRPSNKQAPELYKTSELGMIPKEWEVKRLEEFDLDILDGDRGVNYPKADDFFASEHCLFLSASNVTKNGFVFQNMQFITEDKDFILGTGKLQRHDIVLTTRGTVGNMAFYSDEIGYANIRINSGMLILRNNQKDFNSYFLYLSIKEYIFRKEYGRVISGSAQPQLPIKDFRKFNILKPEVGEQKEIEKRLSAIDDKLRTEETLLQKYQSIKRGLMGDLLGGKKAV